jgi:hypothetical protein
MNNFIEMLLYCLYDSKNEKTIETLSDSLF